MQLRLLSITLFLLAIPYSPTADAGGKSFEKCVKWCTKNCPQLEESMSEEDKARFAEIWKIVVYIIGREVKSGPEKLKKQKQSLVGVVAEGFKSRPEMDERLQALTSEQFADELEWLLNTMKALQKEMNG